MTTVLITGAHGFIARSLAPVLRDAGMRVAGTSRQGLPVPGFDAVYPASLGDALGPILAAEHIDAVVHAALDTGPDAYRVNVDGTTRWLDGSARNAASPCRSSSAPSRPRPMRCPITAAGNTSWSSASSSVTR